MPYPTEDEWLPENKRSETPAERSDRNFVELLQEFRVAQTLVQIIFAFLLPIPFAPGFDKLSSMQEWLYLLALLASALGTVLFVAPVSMHRMLFRMGLKDKIIRIASKFCQGGLVMMWVAMLSAVYVVTSMVFDFKIAIAAAVLGFISVAFFWYVIPLYYRKKFKEEVDTVA